MKFSKNMRKHVIQGRDVNGMLRLISPKCTKDRNIQEWHLLVLNRLMTPSKWHYLGNWDYFTPLIGVMTSFMTGRGPPCRTVKFCFCLWSLFFWAVSIMPPFHIRFTWIRFLLCVRCLQPSRPAMGSPEHDAWWRFRSWSTKLKNFGTLKTTIWGVEPKIRGGKTPQNGWCKISW